MNDTSHLLPAGTQLDNNRYTIIRFIKPGGFGNVYLAENNSIKKKFAIKELFISGHAVRNRDNTVTLQNFPADKFTKAKQQLLAEGKLLSNLKHPNIVQVFEVFAENNTVYLVLEYIEGININDWVKINGQPTLEQTTSWVTAIGGALDMLHQLPKPIYHLDIKPSNIVIEKGTRRPVLIDFGASKQTLQNELPRHTSLAHTVGYSAPEQIKRKVTLKPALDVYALGATTFYLLTGMPPTEDVAARLRQVKLSPLTRSATQKSLHDNYKKRGTLREFLAVWANYTPPAPADNTIYDDDKPVTNQRSPLVGLVALATVFLVGIFLWWNNGSNINTTTGNNNVPADSILTAIVPLPVDTITSTILDEQKDSLSNRQTDESEQTTKPDNKKKKKPRPFVPPPPVIKQITYRGEITKSKNAVPPRIHELRLELTKQDGKLQPTGLAYISDPNDPERTITLNLKVGINKVTQKLDVESTGLINANKLNFCSFQISFPYEDGVGKMEGTLSAFGGYHPSGDFGECLSTGADVSLNLARDPS